MPIHDIITLCILVMLESCIGGIEIDLHHLVLEFDMYIRRKYRFYVKIMLNWTWGVTKYVYIDLV